MRSPTSVPDLWVARSPERSATTSSRPRRRWNAAKSLPFAQIRREYFDAPAKRPIYIQIPAEDREPGDEGKVAKLNLSLYGTRDAAMNWADCYTKFLLSRGFAMGRGCTCNS